MELAITRLGLRFPEPADAEFVARVRRAIADADEGARECAGIVTRGLAAETDPVVTLTEEPADPDPVDDRMVITVELEDYAPDAARPCKTDGCSHDANTRYDRGPLHGLCEEVCVPARREKMSATGRASRMDGQKKPADRVKGKGRYSKGGTQTKWTRATVSAALVSFHSTHGFWPRAGDLDAAGNGLPSFKSVLRVFASLDEAVEVCAGGEGERLVDVAAALEDAYRRLRAAEAEVAECRARLLGHPALSER